MKPIINLTQVRAASAMEEMEANINLADLRGLPAELCEEIEEEVEA
jgi:hypothetical protein